ncbi:2OG-Fe(II) oxygenase [Glycomyces tritici]
MRYEAHVDSNPLQGLLYVTDHPPGAGGELVVAQCYDASGITQIEENSAQIYPKAGYLVLFDARKHAHYVRSLRSSDAVRVVAAMNFYTPDSPESSRPTDLTKHLFGDD